MKRLVGIVVGVLMSLAPIAGARAQQTTNPPVNYPTQTGAFSAPGVTQMCLNSSGNAVPVSSGQCANPSPVTVAPYNYTPLSPGQYGLSISSATGLTIPTGSTYAVVCASGNNVNYTTDGSTTPTASVGMPLLTSQCMSLSGATVLANFMAIQRAATATLNVSFFK